MKTVIELYWSKTLWVLQAWRKGLACVIVNSSRDRRWKWDFFKMATLTTVIRRTRWPATGFGRRCSTIWRSWVTAVAAVVVVDWPTIGSPVTRSTLCTSCWCWRPTPWPPARRYAQHSTPPRWSPWRPFRSATSSSPASYCGASSSTRFSPG